MFDTPLNTNDQSIDRVLKSGLPVMLIFLPGSPPADLSSELNRLAGEHAGKLLIAQVKIKDNPESARRYDVQTGPTLIGFQNGQMATRQDLIGGQELGKFAQFLLGKGPNPASMPKPTAQTEPQGEPKIVTDRTFDQEVLHSRVPVLVDFWAPWCGPCRMTEPAVERLAREQAGKLLVAKVNVDENPMLSQRYQILSIPMMLVIKNGTIVDRWAGALPEPNLRGRVMAVLAQT